MRSLKTSVNSDDAKEIIAAAAKAGLSVASYLRFAALKVAREEK
jgi:hypothetical protein